MRNIESSGHISHAQAFDASFGYDLSGRLNTGLFKIHIIDRSSHDTR